MDILIENSSAQLHGIGRPAAGNAAGALVTTSLVTLKPGLNKVDSEAWALAKKQVMVQKQLDEGVFRELKEVDSLSRLSPIEAERYIQLAFDAKMLLEWKAQEKRVKIKKSLDERLAFLEGEEAGTRKPEGRGGKRE